MPVTVLRLRFWFVVAVGVVLVAGAIEASNARQNQDKQVFVTVMNLRTGSPVAGVTTAALAIKEDGADREIVKVEPATGPMSVVLLADTTTTFRQYVNELRAAAKGFIAAFMAKQPGSAMSLWRFGGAGVPVTQFVTDVAPLLDEAGKLRPVDILDKTDIEKTRDETDSNLLEGVIDGAKALGKRPEARRAIVSFNTITASEKSKIQKSQVQNELQKNGAAWFAVTIADGGTGSPLRDSIMAEVLPTAGGLRMTIQEIARLEPALKAVVDMLASQYVVTYRRASGSPKEIAITVNGENMRAFYSRLAPK